MAEKNKLVKNITIDELAVIINKGFNGQMDYLKENFETINEKFSQVATKTQVQGLEKRLGKVEEDVKYIKENLDEASKLGQRVDYIENTLNIPAIKKN